MAQRIVSLLPSATEICCALGLADRLVGVSHECDFPEAIGGRPVLTAAKLGAFVSSVEIDEQVSRLVSDGLSVYRIDELLLRELAPDLVVTQDTCQVCAVSLGEVEAACRKVVGLNTEVVSLSPMTLNDVLDDITKVGAATGMESEASRLVAHLQRRLDRLASQTASLTKRRVLVVEWMDPVMIAGHWTPELIEIAGGEPILGHRGSSTGPTPWETVVAANPEVILVIPCGFPVDQILREWDLFSAREGFSDLTAARNGAVYAVDGNAYFNRPGPRLVDSAEIVAGILHPEKFPNRLEHDAWCKLS